MAVTRSFLKGMSLTDEQVSAIIEEHTNTISGLKADRDKYKADAEKLAEVQTELDNLKKDDWKAKFDKEHSDFEAFKSNAEKAKTLESVKDAYKALLKAQKVGEKHIDSVMRVTDFGNMVLKDGKLEGEDKLIDSIKKDWGGFIYSDGTQGANVETPPAGTGKKLSTAEIYAKDEHGRYKLSTAERQKAIAENLRTNQ